MRGFVEISSVLLAAGRGKRMRPLTDRIPKPALPVLDVPLAAWGLAALTQHARPTVVNVSHLADQVVAALRVTGIGGWEPLVEGVDAYGTAGTLRALRDRLGPRVVTWNGDALTDLHLPDLLTAHAETRAPATLLVREVDTMADLTLQGCSVTGFVDRRKEPDAAGGRFLGVAVFEREALDRLPDHRPAGLGETLLRELANGGDLNVHLFDGYLRDVGTPAEYLQASLDVLAGTGPLSPIELPGEIVDVDGGRAYVGPGSNAAPETLGPGAILLAGAQVGPGARIQRSIVFPGPPIGAGERLDRTIWFQGKALQIGG
jgi:mannose-1-phosphate guanylyltransferase